MTDVIEKPAVSASSATAANPGREKLMLGYVAVVAVAAGALLTWASLQPHVSSAAEAEGGPVITPVAAGQVAAKFPAADIANFTTITTDTLAKVQAGDQQGAVTRIKDLETAWDDDQARLQPIDDTTWTAIDGRIDAVLTSIRAGHPDPATETQTLNDLLGALR